mmetsp:Transcript_16479/g.31236  ORF Transcript_16479/g.31236 Transcript_16479/m.31236 type:complete len:106 (+) Transcript_16479:780-1097(+)
MPRSYFGCFCYLLSRLVPGNLTANVLGRYCTPSKYLDKARIFFAKELFGMVVEINPDKMTFAGQPWLDSNATCCIIVDKFYDPVTIPGKFWVTDPGTKAFNCTTQ